MAKRLMKTAEKSSAAQRGKKSRPFLLAILAIVIVGGSIASTAAFTPVGSQVHDQLARVDPVTIFGSVWQAGLDQIRNLNWQAAVVLLSILILAALLATWVLRISWRFRKPTLVKREIKPNAHLYTDHLRISKADAALLLETDPNQAGAVVADRMANEKKGHFVITIIESTSRRVCVYREMHLQYVQRRGAVDTGKIQLAADDLTAVRRRNGYTDDDDESGPEGIVLVNGTYDVYIRPVRWFDVRHWLLHPNREIRIVVWVTLITTLFPMLLGYLFDAN
jgi:hypothetical protein